VDPEVANAHSVDTKYSNYLIATGLQGARIGFSRDAIQPQGPLVPDPLVVSAANQTVEDMRTAGALIQDLNLVSQIAGLILSANSTRECGGSWNRKGIEDYLATSPMPDCPVKTIQDIIDSGVYPKGDLTRNWLDDMVNATLPPEIPCASYDNAKATAQKLVLDSFAANNVDFILYPTMTGPPTLMKPNMSDIQITITFVSASTGLPSITFPVAYGPDGIPIGMSLTGRPYSEGDLIKLVYGFEEAIFNKRRRQPKDYPPLP